MSDTPRTEWQDVIRKNSVPNEAGCWIWQRAVNARGYGSLALNGHDQVAHRVSYRAFKGEIPGGHRNYICHACDVKLCVNPDHLELGTPAKNLNDAYGRGRRRKVSDEAKAEIERLRFEGRGVPEIAKQLGLSRHAVDYHVNGSRNELAALRRENAALREAIAHACECEAGAAKYALEQGAYQHAATIARSLVFANTPTTNVHSEVKS